MRAAALLLVALLGTSSAWAASDVLCQSYVVQSGDSIWSVSSLFGVQQDDLQASLQQCVGYVAGTSLQVGQKICLPPWVPACDYVIDSGDVPTCKAYQVQAGDTLASIASSFGIYTQDLLSLNADLVKGVLQVGKFIRLPPWNQASCPDPDSDAASCRVYTVQSGDFVFGVSSVFRVTMADLLAVNPGLESNTLLQAGQRIRIPPFTDSCGNGIVATPPTTGVFSCRAYKVKSGDSLAGIALLFETTVAALVSTNPELSDPALLTPGKIVKIPPYPGECINGILIDPKSSAAATPAGPVSAPTTVASPSPSPVVASPSPSPSPVIASPSPSPVVASPSPSPVVASPSPSPSPAATTPAPTTGITISFTLSGISSTAFATKQAQLATSLASLLGVSSSWVTVTAGVPSQRRLQAATDATSVTVKVATSTPTATAAKLQSAVSSGALSSVLSQLGLTLSPNSLAVSTYNTSAPSPSTSASPSPAPTTTTTTTTPASSGGSSSNVGAIVGGVVGGVGGALLVAGLAWFIVVKRRRAAAGEGGLRASYAPTGTTAHVSTGGAGLAIKTQAKHLKEDQGISSSPRNSNITPRTRVGNMA